MKPNVAFNCFKQVFDATENGNDVDQQQSLKEFACILCHWLPELLCENYEFWHEESLDLIEIQEIRLSGGCELEFIGMCALISNYTMTPIYVKMVSDLKGGSFRYISCKIGVSDNGQLKTFPFRSYAVADIKTISLHERLHGNEWKLYMSTLNLASNINWYFDIERI